MPPSISSLKSQLPYLMSLPDFDTFLRKNNYAVGKVDCGSCHGEGRKYDFADRDLYEGYKLADKKPCKHCKGTGRITVEEARVTYDIMARQLNEQINRYNKDALMCQSIRDKLSKEERQFIGLDGPITILKEYQTCDTNFR